MGSHGRLWRPGCPLGLLVPVNHRIGGRPGLCGSLLNSHLHSPSAPWGSPQPLSPCPRICSHWMLSDLIFPVFSAASASCPSLLLPCFAGHWHFLVFCGSCPAYMLVSFGFPLGPLSSVHLPGEEVTHVPRPAVPVTSKSVLATPAFHLQMSC